MSMEEPNVPMNEEAVPQQNIEKKLSPEAVDTNHNKWLDSVGTAAKLAGVAAVVAALGYAGVGEGIHNLATSAYQMATSGPGISTLVGMMILTGGFASLKGGGDNSKNKEGGNDDTNE